MMVGKISLILWHKSLVMHLCKVLQHDIGMKSVATCGLGTLGNTTNFVALKYLGMLHARKNSWTSEQIIGPIVPHVALKKSML